MTSSERGILLTFFEKRFPLCAVDVMMPYLVAYHLDRLASTYNISGWRLKALFEPKIPNKCSRWLAGSPDSGSRALDKKRLSVLHPHSLGNTSQPLA